MLKTYNHLEIKQLGVHTVGLRHKYKTAKCRFFVIPGEGPALLGMPDIEVLRILKITLGVIGNPPENKKFNSQTIKATTLVAEQTKPHRTRQIQQMYMIIM